MQVSNGFFQKNLFTLFSLTLVSMHSPELVPLLNFDAEGDEFWVMFLKEEVKRAKNGLITVEKKLITAKKADLKL